MRLKFTAPSVLTGLCCIGILTAAYIPDDLPLVFVELHRTQSERSNGDNVCLVSPDGKHVYYVGGSRIQQYARDPGTGQLTPASVAYNDGFVGHETASAISPDGSRFYESATAYHVPDIVRSFRRDQQTGALTYHSLWGTTQREVDRVRSVSVYAAPSLKAMACSHDGKHVYATSQSGNLLLVFACQGDQLSLAQTFQDDDFPQSTVNGQLLPTCIEGAEVVDGLRDALSVLVSPDDRFVYVSARIDESIAVFERDAASGRLNQIQLLTNKVQPALAPSTATPPATQLGGNLTFGPAGMQIYDVRTRSVTVLARDPATGELQFASSVAEQAGSLPSLVKARNLVVSKSGKHAFVASAGDQFSHRGAIMIFTRDAATGALEFLKTVDRKEVAGACHLSLSPDGRHLYAASKHHTLAVFAVNEYRRDPESDTESVATTDDPATQ